MINILVAPDKFKGSLSAAEVCRVIAQGIRRFDESIKVASLPLADGGEGTLDLLIPRLGLDTQRVRVHDPLLRPVEAYYGTKGTTAYVELAVASGLALLADHERNPRRTTSYGTGELILDAVRRGARQVYVFIGGSATNDAGIGAAQALGYRFLDTQGQVVSPTGESLSQIATVRADHLAIDLSQVAVRVVSDVDNPLYGPQGAARVYGPQKGADAEAVVVLERGLINIADRMEALTGRDVRNITGAGAAGGFGAGAMAWLHAQLLPGIGTIMNLCGAADAVRAADLVISGEGQVDRQTLHGKVVKGVGELCRTHGVPLGVICGTLAADEAALQRLNVWRAYAVKEDDMTLADALAHTEAQVEALAYRMMQDFTR